METTTQIIEAPEIKNLNPADPTQEYKIKRKESLSPGQIERIDWAVRRVAMHELNIVGINENILTIEGWIDKYATVCPDSRYAICEGMIEPIGKATPIGKIFDNMDREVIERVCKDFFPRSLIQRMMDGMLSKSSENSASFEEKTESEQAPTTSDIVIDSNTK